MKYSMLFVMMILAAGAQAAEPVLVPTWPQFRGPNGSGVAQGQKPPVEFGVEKNLKWKVEVPGGLSCPVVAGDKLVITAFIDGKLFTIAYHHADGKEAWRAQAPAKKVEPFFKTDGSPAASSAATDGQRIIVYFGSCGLICYDLAGKELWKHEMEMVKIPGDFGTGTSPIVADGLVIVVRDGLKDSKIVAVDVATGTLKWETKRLSPSSYCTPVIWDTPAGKQVVAAGHARMAGYDLKTGEEKWTVLGMPSACTASPIAADGILYFAGWSPGGAEDKEFQMPAFDDLLKEGDTDKNGSISKAESEKTFLKDFFASNDMNGDGSITREEWDGLLKFMREGKNSAFALKAGGSGDITATHMLWKKTRGLPYIASALVYQGQLITVKDGGIVTAFDIKTGDEIYTERAVEGGRYYASPVAANGHIYFTSLDDGVVTVLKAGSETAQVVAKNPKLGERVASTPAIADDAIYIRAEKHLYAFSAGK